MVSNRNFCDVSGFKCIERSCRSFTSNIHLFGGVNKTQLFTTFSSRIAYRIFSDLLVTMVLMKNYVILLIYIVYFSCTKSKKMSIFDALYKVKYDCKNRTSKMSYLVFREKENHPTRSRQQRLKEERETCWRCWHTLGSTIM